MTNPIDTSSLSPTQHMVGEDAEDTRLLSSMLEKSREYLQSFEWFTSIREEYFAFGVGGVVAVFLFHMRDPAPSVDEWMWVISGDIPCAYLDVIGATSPKEALEIYCQLMEEWADAVLNGKSRNDVYPVHAEPTENNARSLKSRIEFIRRNVLPAAD